MRRTWCRVTSSAATAATPSVSPPATTNVSTGPSTSAIDRSATMPTPLAIVTAPARGATTSTEQWADGPNRCVAANTSSGPVTSRLCPPS